MIIPITDDVDEIVSIGKVLYEENQFIYTLPLKNWMFDTIKINGISKTSEDVYDIFYTSIYDYCIYGIRLNEWFEDSFYKKSHAEKLSLVEKRQKRFLLKEAESKFASNEFLHGSFEDYKCALESYVVSFSEYMWQYNFWERSDIERQSFISRFSALQLYRRLVLPDIKDLFTNKIRFLNEFKNFVHREYMLVNDHSYEEFTTFVRLHDCIAKPLASSCGVGIFKVYSITPELELKNLYTRLKSENYLLEECIHNSAVIEAFHPQSLNTIRVVTLSNNDKVVIFGSFIRVGVHGNVIDNAHAGGIFAQINVETGLIESDGIDTNGNMYPVHPDTGIRFKGFKIPLWKQIKVCCERACRQYSGIHIAGWDIALLPDNEIEIVEGNYGPDFDVMQSPLKVGVRDELTNLVNKLFN
ncbi:sugar-transfer associated ATP-grasp domain-containing protein [Butyricimonas hominis]|mgnify:FL=1|uniref:sugar-transfer associated ATP-grasp domain-containing protein n=1 Tax=Butyricimonas TaxID=574697 RepID=UPI0035133C16